MRLACVRYVVLVTMAAQSGYALHACLMANTSREVNASTANSGTYTPNIQDTLTFVLTILQARRIAVNTQIGKTYLAQYDKQYVK